MTSALICDGVIESIQSNGFIPTCSTEWIISTPSQILQMGYQASIPSPENLFLAFGAGVSIMLPLYAVLWGVRAARSGIKQS